MSQRGLLLLAHGARNPQWAQPFEKVALALRARHPDALVRLAYLEFLSPTLPEAAAELCAAGARQIELLPMFLGSSGHVQREVPVLIEQAERELGCQIHVNPALGEQERVLQAMVDSAAALIAAP
ncbi:sirohydrochlorin cobaltochelatase [Inhella inkyongensis]|uniref:Sirohydrochlorin cobaltochelatase n=1 Tax=Inhella inkyongensis TaxID=392593 RepID=A0A840SAW8_9BURK|nr:CbiX/SirB N-terminal domain-containing protein [Inhella inkyongensis]MBB5205519.1 sirohydrochlorin cobaltochelatase [Inhella inkyongensis]